MGLADCINAEDRVTLKVSDLKVLIKGCVQRDMLMNGIKTRTSHDAMYQMMTKFTLVGVDGNAFSIMGYTARALRRAGLNDLVDQMYSEAESGDYYNLIAVCDSYIDKANEALGLTDEEYEE